jgi:Tetratricopeptide repeat
MSNLAEILRDERNLNAAGALHEKALAISGRILGEEHPDTSVSE